MQGNNLNNLSIPSQTLDNLRDSILESVAEFAALKYSSKNMFKQGMMIPSSGKIIGGLELQYMVEAVLDGWLTTGRFNAQFEAELSEFLGVKYVLTTNSGSSANLLAFSALTSPKLGSRTIKVGDEVISVAAAFPTTVNPILQNGCIPVFVDIEIPTYNIAVTNLEAALSPKTKAVFLAHTLGNPFNLKVVREFCDRYNLWLIEDCCDALGAKYDNKMVGSFGDIATLSFYPAHHITMGEGGAVFTNNEQLKIILESFRDWGRDCYCATGKDNTCGQRFCYQLGDLPLGYDHKYTYSHLGYNLKITDIQAACGLAQLKRLGGFILQRKNNFNYLLDKLLPYNKLLILPEATRHSEPSWFGFPLTLKPNVDFSRNHLVEYLNQNNIATRLLFGGNLTKQPYMLDQKFRIIGMLINTDIVMQRTFWLGVAPNLSEQMLDYMVEVIANFCVGVS